MSAENDGGITCSLHKFYFHYEVDSAKCGKESVDLEIKALNSEEAYIYVNQLYPDFFI
ncbi:MAG: hypothetical protein K0S55_644 [Clostridia bacterium]|jgi:hypothetical protein|nr:hypothetical protein [Clostridia bacterium]